MRRGIELCVALVLGAALPAGAEEHPPNGYDTVDREVTIRMRPGTLRYALESFHVGPGSKVKLVLDNNDDLQHNLILCTGGRQGMAEVVEAALKLGPEGIKREFIPDHPRVWVATKMVAPGESDTIYFAVPNETGEFHYVCTFPGHGALMKGAMNVAENGSGLSDLRYRLYKGDWDRLPDFSSLKPEIEQKLPDNRIDLGVTTERDYFALVFTGTLAVPEEGDYRFFLDSDDGSRLTIDGTTVVESDGVHGMAGSDREGTAKLSQGNHAFEFSYFENAGEAGVRLAWSGPGIKPVSLTNEVYTVRPRNRERGVVPIVVKDVPRIHRVHLPDLSPRGIAVGLPGGTNFAFDAEVGAIVYGWLGEFIDVAPDREGRGGNVCRPLGELFALGAVECPLSFGDEGPGPIRFGGYTIEGNHPIFEFTLGDVHVEQEVRSLGEGAKGLVYAFSISGNDRTARFQVDPSRVEVKCSQGDWDEDAGVLTLSPKEAREFEVKILSKGN